jgi:hypothetical protein
MEGPGPPRGEEHGDADAHAGVPLGPVDPQAWGARALGVGIALVMTRCCVLATAPAAS